MNIIALCPIYDRLDIAKASIQSLLDLNINVVGITDGLDINFESKCEIIKKEKDGIISIAKNAFYRLEEGIKSNKEWIYLFDSDTLHLPSCLTVFDYYINILKDNEIGSLYHSKIYRTQEQQSNFWKCKGLGGVSLFMNRATAIKAYSVYNTINWEEWKEKKKWDWDNEVTKLFTCYKPMKSFMEHLGTYTGKNGLARKKCRIEENAKRNIIDENELKGVLKKYDLEGFEY